MEYISMLNSKYIIYKPLKDKFYLINIKQI